MEIWSSGFLLITMLFFFVAIAYSSVGHAGASGYSAVMAIVGVSPILMRPTSLMLNIIVGSIGFYRFHRAGLVNFKKVLPFLVTSMPVAYWSAQLIIEKKYFYLALGIILLISGTRLLFKNTSEQSTYKAQDVFWPAALFAGGFIGFLSGITGTGGAIFFTPLLLQMKWADPKHAAGLSVVFVLANSIFGLTGILKSSEFFHLEITLVWAVAVTIGALIGTYFGAFKLSNARIQKVLGAVMLLAAFKLLSLY